MIGSLFGNPTLNSDMQQWPFAVISEGGKLKIKVVCKGEQTTFLPIEILSMILARMKETAEEYLGRVGKCLCSLKFFFPSVFFYKIKIIFIFKKYCFIFPFSFTKELLLFELVPCVSDCNDSSRVLWLFSLPGVFTRKGDDVLATKLQCISQNSPA